MKAVLQRVSRASVSVGGEVVGKIGPGLVVLVGVANGDTAEDVTYLVQKTLDMRIFADSEGKFNLAILDTRGDLLLVSQFTLLASTRKGRRPSFTDAAPPALAEELFNQFVAQARASGLKVETGRFQQHMQVEIHNDGPVTIVMDSRERLNSRG
jgi:D-tyrosyl-tRNA(Tyr) deacylase